MSRHKLFCDTAKHMAQVQDPGQATQKAPAF